MPLAKGGVPAPDFGFAGGGFHHSLILLDHALCRLFQENEGQVLFREKRAGFGFVHHAYALTVGITGENQTLCKVRCSSWVYYFGSVAGCFSLGLEEPQVPQQ